MKPTFAKTALAALLATAAISASAAPADIQSVQTLGVLSTDAVIGDAFTGGNKTFDEFFQFSLASLSQAGWTLTASVAGNSGLSNLTADLFAGTVSTLNHGAGDPVALVSGVAFTDNLSDPSAPTLWAFDPGSLTLGAGQYTLVVSGKTLADGGAFGGTVSISPVPEPEGYAMFLAGLGILGSVVRRRTADGRNGR